MVGYGTQEEVLAALEDQLNRSEYIASDRFTAADVYVGAQIGSGMMYGMIDKRPAFERYWDRLDRAPGGAASARDRRGDLRLPVARLAEDRSHEALTKERPCD